MQLADKRRLVGREGRMVLAGQLQGVGNIQSVQRIEARGGQAGLHEADPMHNANLDGNAGRLRQDQPNRGFANHGITGNSVHKAVGAGGVPQNLPRDLLIDLIERACAIVQVIKGTPLAASFEALAQRMGRSHEDGRRFEQPLARFQGQLIGRTWAQADNVQRIHDSLPLERHQPEI